MTTTFSACNPLDNIQFYVDPRSIEASRNHETRGGTPLVPKTHRVDDSSDVAVNATEFTYCQPLSRSDPEIIPPDAGGERLLVEWTTATKLQASWQQLGDCDANELEGQSGRVVSAVPPYTASNLSSPQDGQSETNCVLDETSADDNIETRLRQALTKTQASPTTRPSARLCLPEASGPQQVVQVTQEETSAEECQCDDSQTYDRFDVRVGTITADDQQQVHPIFGARSQSRYEGQRDTETPTTDIHNEIRNANEFSDEDANHNGTESDSSGSDVLRFPRRIHTRKHFDAGHARPSASPQPSHSIDDSRRRQRLRRGRQGVQRSTSPPTAYVLIPPTPRQIACSLTSTPSRLDPVTCLTSMQFPDSKIQVVIELPMSALETFISRSTANREELPTSGSALITRSRYSTRENILLARLKRQREPRLSWKAIQSYFPNRTVNALQVHFYTRLRPRHLGK